MRPSALNGAPAASPEYASSTEEAPAAVVTRRPHHKTPGQVLAERVAMLDPCDALALSAHCAEHCSAVPESRCSAVWLPVSGCLCAVCVLYGCLCAIWLPVCCLCVTTETVCAACVLSGRLSAVLSGPDCLHKHNVRFHHGAADMTLLFCNKHRNILIPQAYSWSIS